MNTVSLAQKTVADIWEEYHTQGWEKPVKWLIDYDVVNVLLSGPQYSIYTARDEHGQIKLTGIPVQQGRFTFGIAVIATHFKMCRVGDFVEHGTVGVPDYHNNFVYQPSWPLSMLLVDKPTPESIEMQPRWYFEKQKFIDGNRLYYLWKRIE